MSNRFCLLKLMIVFLCGSCLFGLTSCSSSTGNTEMNITEEKEGVSKEKGGDQPAKSVVGDLISEEVEIIDTSGKDEYERSTDISSVYDPRMFWGLWILKGEKETSNTPSSGAKGVIELNRDKSVSKVEGLPYVIQFGPLRSNEFILSGFGKSISIKDYGYAELLYRLANTSSESREDESYADINNDNGRWCRAAFAVENGTMAFGLFDQFPKRDDMTPGSTVHVTETDYSFDWRGSELKLSLNGDSAVYVPLVYQENQNRITFDGAYNFHQEEEDGFIRLAITGDEVVAEKYFEPKDLVEIDYNADGSGFVITGSDQHQYTYDTYYYSGQTLTLLNEGNIEAFDCSNRNSGRNDSKFRFWPYAEDWVEIDNGDYDIQQMEDLFEIPINFILENRGYPTEIDANLDMEIDSCTVTDYFALKSSSLTYYVKAVNIYNHPVALRDCFICCAYVDGTSSDNKITINDLRIGDAGFLNVKNKYSLPCYRIDHDHIVFTKTRQENIFENDEFIGIDKNSQVLHDDNICRYVFMFKDGVLVSMECEVPSLLYYGLEDNLEFSELENISPSEAAKAMSTRKELVQKLSEAFNEAGINADVNTETGVISLDSEILYDSAKYELKDEGKEYIDGITTALLNTIIDENVKESLDKIEIIGHTDTNGTYAYNLLLSQQRADSVKEYILENAESKLEAGDFESFKFILSAVGKSFNDPVFGEDGLVDMDASRRVEIKFYIKMSK